MEMLEKGPGAVKVAEGKKTRRGRRNNSK